MPTLAHLLAVLAGARYWGNADPATITVVDVTADSRAAGPGALFVAVAGGRADGHRYIDHAFAQGAAAVLGTASHSHLRQKLRRPAPGYPRMSP